MAINWYPGHMFKTKRDINDSLKLINVALEVRDARIPMSSSNIDLKNMLKNKKSIKRIIILNKSDLADPEETEKWIKRLKKEEDVLDVIPFVAINNSAVEQLKQKLLKEKKGIATVKILILGIPNIGKSTLINMMSGKKTLEVKNKAGVTKKLKWLRVDKDISMLDTPGMLWPKFEDESVGEKLGITGAIKEEILDEVELAYSFIKMCLDSPTDIELVCKKYDISSEELEKIKQTKNIPYTFLKMVALKKKILMQGGDLDISKTSKLILTQYKAGKIGRITLEKA